VRSKPCKDPAWPAGIDGCRAGCDPIWFGVLLVAAIAAGLSMRR